MNIVIAGGTGLVGSALVRHWVKDGHKIVILTRKPRKTGLPSGVRDVAWDGQTLGAWTKVLGGADALVNLAGASIMGRWTAAYKRQLVTSRVHTTQLLLSAIRKVAVRPKVWVNISAAGYYLGHPMTESCTEDSFPGHTFLANLCVQWEGAAAPARDLGVRVVTPRMGLVLSNRGGALPLLSAPFRWFLGGVLGSGRQGFPWVHIDDVVQAIDTFIQTPEYVGAINLTAPHLVNAAQFCLTLADVLNRPCWAPMPPALVRAVLGEAADVILASPRVKPRLMVDKAFPFRFPLLPDALTHLLK